MYNYSTCTFGSRTFCTCTFSTCMLLSVLVLTVLGCINRDLLAPSSGFQSLQFRLIENKLGLKEVRVLKMFN